MLNLNRITDIFSGDKLELITNAPGPTISIIIICIVSGIAVAWALLKEKLDLLDRQLKDEKERSIKNNDEIKILKEENEILKKSLKELSRDKYAQRVPLREKAITTVREVRDFLAKAELEINSNYTLKTNFILRGKEPLSPYAMVELLEDRDIFISNKIKDYEIRFEPDVKALTKSIINILKKENENIDESKLLKVFLENKSFSVISKTLENLEVIAWQLLEHP